MTPLVVIVSLNDTISATCTAEGGPDNQISWSALSTDGQVTALQSDPVLVVEVTEVDDTVYRCIVGNSAGSEEANLTVYSKCSLCIPHTHKHDYTHKHSCSSFDCFTNGCECN